MITLWLFTIAPIAMENQFDDLAIELSNHWIFFPVRKRIKLPESYPSILTSRCLPVVAVGIFQPRVVTALPTKNHGIGSGKTRANMPMKRLQMWGFHWFFTSWLANHWASWLAKQCHRFSRTIWWTIWTIWNDELYELVNSDQLMKYMKIIWD